MLSHSRGTLASPATTDKVDTLLQRYLVASQMFAVMLLLPTVCRVMLCCCYYFATAANLPLWNSQGRYKFCD